ncbi:hypothetical protein TNCV_2437181 [Trichonephila clavipes]|nr:hypothetical protein TNCV_2437181 [Trichonephila clavipes]
MERGKTVAILLMLMSWKRRKGSPAHKNWKFLHIKECLKNQNGSVGMRETVGMVRIFQRSVSHHSVRYISYIGDGDSRSFSSVSVSSLYGEDIPISKTKGLITRTRLEQFFVQLVQFFTQLP